MRAVIEVLVGLWIAGTLGVGTFVVQRTASRLRRRRGRWTPTYGPARDGLSAVVYCSLPGGADMVVGSVPMNTPKYDEEFMSLMMEASARCAAFNAEGKKAIR